MINIRKAIPVDCEVILKWENNPAMWEYTDEPGPFSQLDIANFLQNENSLQRNNQERWMIHFMDQPIGMIDLFEWDSAKNKIGIGIAIPESKNRNKGYAYNALQLAHQTLQNLYDIQEIHCIIEINNNPSRQLFEKLGYKKNHISKHRGQDVYHYHKAIRK